LYVLNIAKLNPKNITEYSLNEAIESINLNCLSVVRIAEEILNINSRAQIIIMGSESGKKGSYDTCYFLAKAALNKYVEERRVGVNQRLIVLSPCTIQDSMMTESRTDKDLLEKYKNKHPKLRFLNMEEVALCIKQIFSMSIFVTNQIISVDGGKFARMGN